MKVVFTFGGMPHYLVALLKYLQEKLFIDVVVVLPEKKSLTIGSGVKLVDEELAFKAIYSPEKNNLLGKPYYPEFANILKTEKPDILVLGWPYIVGYVFDRNAAKIVRENRIGVILREIPLWVPLKNESFSFYKKNPIVDENLNILVPSGLRFYIWAAVLKAVRKMYYRRVDATICYAEIGRKVHQSYGIRPEQIFVTCNSPDTDSLFEAKAKILNDNGIITPKPYSLLHIGRLVKWKKVDLLIRAVASLRTEFPEITLNIIGTGPETETLKHLTKQLGLENQVDFLGGIYEYNKLGKILMSNSLYVLAGMGGLSINEAMAFGKPVICSECDGTEKTLVHHNINGLYFENDNCDDLTAKIAYLFRNPALIEKFGIESEKIIRTKVNIATVGNKIKEAFDYVLKNKNVK